MPLKETSFTWRGGVTTLDSTTHLVPVHLSASGSLVSFWEPIAKHRVPWMQETALSWEYTWPLKKFTGGVGSGQLCS
jgi:hypothetical protein